MATNIVNLTLLKVTHELNNFREIYPEHCYKLIGNNQDLSQQLIVYILNRIPNYFMVISEEQVSLLEIEKNIFSTQDKMQLETLIIQGFYQLSSGELKPTLQPKNRRK